MKVPFLALQFYVAIVLAVLALVFKVERWPGTFALIIAASIAHVIYIASMITEVVTSHKATGLRKILLLISLLAGIAGLFFIESFIFSILIMGFELNYLKRERKDFVLETSAS